MESCPNENAQNSPGSRSWPRNGKPTAASPPPLRTGRRLARLLPLPETRSVRPAVLVLVSVLLLLLLLLVLSRLVPNPRRESTPRGRSRMARRWTFPFRPPRAGPHSPWSNVRRISSRFRLSRSASPLDPHHPITHPSPHTRPRIWQSLRTTTRCLFSMRSPMPEPQ